MKEFFSILYQNIVVLLERYVSHLEQLQKNIFSEPTCLKRDREFWKSDKAHGLNNISFRTEFYMQRNEMKIFSKKLL